MNQKDPNRFAWANRPGTAKVLDFIPHIARKIWRERHLLPAVYDGKIIMLSERDERRRA